VVPESEVKQLKNRIRELERQLGKKTLENEILKEGLELVTRQGRFAVKTIASAFGVSRSNLIERMRRTLLIASTRSSGTAFAALLASKEVITMRRKIIVMSLILAVTLVACAAGLNGQMDMPNAQGIVAGFWRGLWHGAIVPITFVVSLFSHDVTIYEVHNNGGWYNFGFLLGIHAIWGGHAATRSQWNRRNGKACGDAR
jgi:hypothetical protein